MPLALRINRVSGGGAAQLHHAVAFEPLDIAGAHAEPAAEYLGVVVAEDQDIAERRFFDGWVSDTGRLAGAAVTGPPAAASSPFQRPASSDIVGLFPQPEARP